MTRGSLVYCSWEERGKYVADFNCRCYHRYHRAFQTLSHHIRVLYLGHDKNDCRPGMLHEWAFFISESPMLYRYLEAQIAMTLITGLITFPSHRSDKRKRFTDRSLCSIVDVIIDPSRDYTIMHSNNDCRTCMLYGISFPHFIFTILCCENDAGSDHIISYEKYQQRNK